ncbi:MAG: hypothetical protein IH957_05315 [Chloroflexi bacterium]|nr:hypothetical protein [Chloroflexota bacterium]
MTVDSPTQTTSAEAQEVLDGLIQRLATGGADLPSALRDSLHACNLMGWLDAAEWIRKEIKGYDATSPVPPYRVVGAYVTWRPYAMDDIIEQVVVGRRQPEQRDLTSWTLLPGIERIVEYAQKGVIVREEADEERWFDVSKKMTKGRSVTMVEAPQAKRCLDRLQNELFDWASKASVALRTGDLTADLWSEYRRRVDEALGQLGLAPHLEAIVTGMTSENPQDWRQAMYGVRDVLHDVAKYLWRDGRDTYEYLKNDKGKPFRVTESDYVNRLCCYLHQKGVTGTDGAYLRSEVSRLHALNGLASKAHDEVTLEEARAGAVALYTVLGIFTIHTDMIPIEKYGPLENEADAHAEAESPDAEVH